VGLASVQRDTVLITFKLRRDIPLLLEMRKEFDCEIVPLLIYDVSQKIVENDRELSKLFPRYVSLPQFYYENIAELRGMSEALVLAEIQSFEEKWGIQSVSEFAYMDRLALQEKRFSAQITHILLWLRLVDRIIETVQPLFYFRGGHHTLFLNILDRAFKAHGIPFLCTRDSTLPGRICYTDENNRIVGWQYYYNLLKVDRSRRDSVIAGEALAWLKSFQERPQRPPYAEQFSIVKWDYARVFRDLRLAFEEKRTIGLSSYLFNRKRFDRAMHISGPVGGSLYEDYLKVFFRKMAQKRLSLFNRSPDLSVPFIYFPLQLTPEVTTLAYGRGYEDQEHLVTRLAASLPSNIKLYVKEHTSMVGRRQLGMYRRLKKLYNVELVSPEISTFDLIQNCVSVATINSTAGWEAFNLGKPCLFFGHAFYADFKNVLQVDLVEGLGGKIRKYLDGFEPDWRDIEDANIAYFEGTHLGEIHSKLASGESATVEGMRKNARLLCQSAKEQLELRRKMGEVQVVQSEMRKAR